MVLTAAQRTELNQAILEYLIKQGFKETADNFQIEAQIQLQQEMSSSSAKNDLLERKWTSLARLKKQVIELEKKCDQLKESGICERCESLGDSLNTNSKSGDGMPREPEKFQLTGHRGKVTKVVIHPFFSICVSASEDATIKLWDYEQGESERTLKGHSGIVQGLAFDSKGQKLASSASDMSIKIWDLQKFICMKTINGHEHEVSSVAFLPHHNDYLLSVSRDNTIRLWDPISGINLQNISTGHTEWIKRVAITHSGRYFATSSKDETIIVWNTDQLVQMRGGYGKNVSPMVTQLCGHENQIDCIVWAPLEAARCIEGAEYSGGIYSSHANSAAVVTQQQAIMDQAQEEEKQQQDAKPAVDIAKLPTRERVNQLKAELQAKKQAAQQHAAEAKEESKEESKKAEFIIPDSEVRDFIASGSRDKSIRIWDAKNGRQIAILIGHDNWVTDLCFHPNNKHLISVSDDMSLRVWDLQTTRCYRKMLKIHSHFITSVAIKQKTIITSSVDQSVKVWSCR